MECLAFKANSNHTEQKVPKLITQNSEHYLKIKTIKIFEIRLRF